MTSFSDDIPTSLAAAAHRGTSHVPDERARQEREGYARTLADDLAQLERLATTDAKRATLTEEWNRYRAGYRTRYQAMLAARSRCVSAMITGPARFPTERNRKRNATADKRSGELIDYRERALAAIRRALTPELQPIMAGDSDALTRLRGKLSNLTEARDHEKRANAAIRAAVKALGRPTTQTDHLAIIAALDVPGPIRAHLNASARAFQWVPQFGANTSAEIRRVEERIKALEIAKATPDQRAEVAATGIAIEDSAADNRIRLRFPGKPDAAIRDRLKRAGFRWAPTLGAWQAYRNRPALALAYEIAGLPQNPTTLAEQDAAADARTARHIAAIRTHGAEAVIDAERHGERLAPCACHRGGFCDVSHDPAACGCGRCGA